VTRARAFVLPNGTHAVAICEFRLHGTGGLWAFVTLKEIK